MGYSYRVPLLVIKPTGKRRSCLGYWFGGFRRSTWKMERVVARKEAYIIEVWGLGDPHQFSATTIIKQYIH